MLGGGTLAAIPLDRSSLKVNVIRSATAQTLLGPGVLLSPACHLLINSPLLSQSWTSQPHSGMKSWTILSLAPCCCDRGDPGSEVWCQEKG